MIDIAGDHVFRRTRTQLQNEINVIIATPGASSRSAIDYMLDLYQKVIIGIIIMYNYIIKGIRVLSRIFQHKCRVTG